MTPTNEPSIDGRERIMAAIFKLRPTMQGEAESDRVREAIDAEITTLTAALTEARAENKRLREALEAIASANSTHLFAWLDDNAPTERTRAGDIRTHVAQAALATPTETKP